ncbi:MAG: transcriptional repressor [Oscillospiraceae bacterium]|nr:transcriptional repressor [Oscillospiraceae bacterium]
MPEGYKTKQRQRVLNYLMANSHRHITVEDAAEDLRHKGEPVGKTTIYRYFERLVEDGLVRKFTAEGESACFQYIAGDTCQEHFHLKCVDCGKLFHLECAYLEQLEQHIFDVHHFTIHSGRTVFYGLCEDCAQKASKENLK